LFGLTHETHVPVVTSVSLSAVVQTFLSLIRELAGLEGYIAETYAQRSLSELFQNSDDCGSTEVGIFRISDYLVYANNGRVFSSIDFESLCKSASSSKVRGKSIGYRGIGFKSVVNICTNVIVASGDLRCAFDRVRTASLLQCSSDVPLVRVPHQLTTSEKSICNEVLQNFPNYSTYFILGGLNEGSINQEFSSLSPEHFLFLRNLSNVSIKLLGGSNKLNLGIERLQAATPVNPVLSVTNVVVSSDLQQSLSRWSVVTKNDVSIAAKTVDDVPSRVQKQEALLHAYLPTQTISGIGARVNADFSTDPSRTRLKYDSTTEEAISKVASLATDIIAELSAFPDSLYWRGFVDSLIPYPDFKILELQGNKFCTSLLPELKLTNTESNENSQGLVIWPDIYKEIESISAKLPPTLNVFLPIAASFADAKRFLDIIGAQKLPILVVLEHHRSPINYIDPHLCPTFLRNAVDEGVDLKSLDSIYAFVCNDMKVVCPREILEKELTLDQGFVTALGEKFLSHRRAKDLLEGVGFCEEHFGNSFKKGVSGVDISSLVQRSGVIPGEVVPQRDLTTKVNTRILDDETKRRYGIQNWRLSEEIVAYYYRSQGLKVIDVSQANKGYDLEVLGDSTRLCVEVKDIKDSVKGFALTQNEFNEAVVLGETYILALVRRGQDESLEIMIIENPHKSLQAFTTKRAKAYEFFVSGFTYRPSVSFS